MKLVAALAAVVLMQATSRVRVVERGDQSNVDERRQVVARTATEFTALWRQHAPDRPQPKVDFAKEMVVALFVGSRPSAGFAVEVLSAEAASEGGTLVRYRETSPERGTLAAQVLTSAYTIVAVPRAAGDVRFERVTS